MVRNLGFFSAHRGPGEAAVMLGLTLRELCGGPIAAADPDKPAGGRPA
jgi:hypothetical protein